MSAPLSIKHLRDPKGLAECEGCNALHPDSTRERCRVHVNLTGHTVRYVIEDITIYRPVKGPTSGGQVNG